MSVDRRLLSARVAPPSRPVYKDECVFSFDTPESPDGLYVSLVSFVGLGRDHVARFSERTQERVFLRIRRERIPAPDTDNDKDEGPDKKITRLAIGVEGGFDPDANKKKFSFADRLSVVLLPEFEEIPWEGDGEGLPAETAASVRSALAAESPAKLADLEALTGTWDGELRQVSAHAVNLKQLDNGVKIPPTGWKCCNCDLTANLWLNLTDGAILCGRKFFDGSGGNNHAVEYFNATGYPLAVKLGTITAEGKADVFSYAEDEMVEDPLLADHLKHFGIDLLSMRKTEKSMVELELEANRHLGEWSLLQESSSDLKPACGPRLTGLINLGNSCYMNSVMQVIFTLPDFIGTFVNKAPEILATFPNDPVNDFNIQTSKLGVGLASGKYSILSEDGSQVGISPGMFKRLIGKSHPEFSTKKQQDALEYYLHFLNILTTNCRKSFNPSVCLKFNVEERIQCGESGCVRYTNRGEHCLGLNVPLAAADNQAEVLEYEAKRMEAEKNGQKDNLAKVRPHIPFKACLDSATQDEKVEQFYSSALQKKVTAIKSTRFATFPDYLMIQLKKFTIDSNWTPIKLDVEVEMPWEMDLSDLRGVGLKQGETLLPEAPGDVPAPQYDEAVVAQLEEMGFPRSACERALFNTKNSGTEAAMNWIMEHIADADFSDPFVPPGVSKPTGTQLPKPSEEDIQMIMSMAFTRAQAERALRETQNNIERAADWIFSHASELDAEETPDSDGPSQEPEYRDGGSKYQLHAFISHMGTSTQVGHYVCHIRHEGEWLIFNDEKVAYSRDPPKNLGYLYLYKRL